MNWYYADRGRQTGPVQQTELEQLVQSGALPSSALVWTEGMADWKPYSTIEKIDPPSTAVQPFAPIELSVKPGSCVCCGRAMPPEDSTVISARTVCFECQPVFIERLREGGLEKLPGLPPYSGFWIRFAAKIADYSLLNIVQSVFIATFFAWMLRPKARFTSDALVGYGVSSLAGMVMSCAYQVFFLTTRGATPGKMLCYLRVIRPDGSPVKMGTAFGRYLGEIVDAFTLGIGYIMVAFDSEKRALHDRLAGTRVIDSLPETLVKKERQPVVREIQCATCHTAIPAQDWNAFAPILCPGCSTPVQALVFPAYSRSLGDSTPGVKTVEGEAGCYYHDGNRATASCEECGRFLCPVCDLDTGSRRLCPNCLNQHLASGRPTEFVQRSTLYDSIALTLALVPNLFLLTIYLTFFTAPIAIGFTIWSWKKQGSITPRTKWRYVVALLVSSVNLLFILLIMALLTAGVFRGASR
ncbi:MAG TPA: RDD family protein [Bryobacteraceae bacterium]|jgi:uncharacterized RDD family membrane protein YckC